MRIHLKKELFGDEEFVLLEHGSMKVTCFRYSTGVEAVKVENPKGYFIILPFQGQQIWRAGFLGHELTMKTKLEEPIPTLDYGKTHGGFLLHCGISAFGVPQEDDNHMHHGETPNAVYENAYIEYGEGYVAVGGSLDYEIPFAQKYTFCPECRLYEDDTVLKVHVELVNRRSVPMEYMYLCHMNFRPMDGARLMYSADYDCEHIKVHKIIGDSVPPEQASELKAYMECLEKEPARHHEIGAAGQIYDPEICFTVMYKGDEQGRAYTLQNRDDGACYVSHPVDVLPYGIRWISRSGDCDSCGMILPATAEHLGYQNAKRNGQIKVLDGGKTLSFDLEAGWLDAERAKELIAAKGLM